MILSFDDETDIADPLGTIFGMHFPEAEICVAYRGGNSARVGDRNPPQAAVLHLEMPGLSGEELASALRAAAGDKPFTLIALPGNVRRLSALPINQLFDHLKRVRSSYTMRKITQDAFRLMLDAASSTRLPPSKAASVFQ